MHGLAPWQMNLSANLVENDVELAALDWFQQLGYTTAFGRHVAPGEPAAERELWRGFLPGAVARRVAEVKSEAAGGSAGRSLSSNHDSAASVTDCQ